MLSEFVTWPSGAVVDMFNPDDPIDGSTTDWFCRLACLAGIFGAKFVLPYSVQLVPLEFAGVFKLVLFAVCYLLGGLVSKISWDLDGNAVTFAWILRCLMLGICIGSLLF